MISNQLFFWRACHPHSQRGLQLDKCFEYKFHRCKFKEFEFKRSDRYWLPKGIKNRGTRMRSSKATNDSRLNWSYCTHSQLEGCVPNLGFSLAMFDLFTTHGSVSVWEEITIAHCCLEIAETALVIMASHRVRAS